MVQITGCYLANLERDENLDQLYEAMGLSFLMRKVTRASIATVRIAYKEEEEEWHFNIATIFNRLEHSFKLGEEYEEKLQNGMLVKSVTTMEGDNKMVTKSKSADKNFTMESHYEFTDYGMNLTMQLPDKNVVAKRYLKRIKGA